MKINKRDLIFRPGFDEGLSDIYDYLAEFSDRSAKSFVKELWELCTNRIANYPESFPEFKLKKTPGKIYRKAIYRKNYYVIYKLEAKRILFLAIFYARRDLSKIIIEE